MSRQRKIFKVTVTNSILRGVEYTVHATGVNNALFKLRGERRKLISEPGTLIVAVNEPNPAKYFIVKKDGSFAPRTSVR